MNNPKVRVDPGGVFTPIGLCPEERGGWTKEIKLVRIGDELLCEHENYLKLRKIGRWPLPQKDDDWEVDTCGYYIPKGWDDRRLLSARVLDTLFSNPELIPESWQDGWTGFLGTLYHRREGESELVSMHYNYLATKHWMRVWTPYDSSFRSSGVFSHAAYLE